MERKPESTLTVLSEQQVKELTTQLPGMATYYVNHARIAPGFYDVRLFLGQSSVTPTGKQIVEEHLCVILSPECGNMLAVGLANSMKQFEQRFGAIRTPPIPSPAPEHSVSTKKTKAKAK